ncbi:MAG: hypothetical protein ABIP48_13080 [Planctomycetota bacterium]
MTVKSRPNHQLYLKALARMTPEERLRKAFELSEMTKELFRYGLRKRFPHLGDEDRKRIYLERLAKCHNRNY